MCTLPVEPCCNKFGNPVTVGSGLKVESETDYRRTSGLTFTRNYHSFRFPDPIAFTPDAHTTNQLGTVWRSNFDKRVIPLGGQLGVTALSFPDGQVQYFDTEGKEIFNYAGARARLDNLAGGGYLYQGPDSVEAYRADGRLLRVAQRTGETLALTYSDGTGGYFVDRIGTPTNEALPANLLLSVADSYGNALSFNYSAPGKLVVMTDPAGGRTLYSYDIQAFNDNLASVTYPDGHTRSYRYTEPDNMPTGIGLGAFPHALTGIVDENGARFASFKYDINGRAASTEHALGAQLYQLSYPTASTTTVIDPLGASRAYTLEVVDGLTRVTSNSLPGEAGFGVGIRSQIYDAKGNVLSRTDFNGNSTCYAYDTARSLEVVRVEGLSSTVTCGTVTAAGGTLPAGSRKITTEWHPRWRVPTRTSEPRRRTTYAYHGDNASCAPASAVIDDGSAAGQPIGVLCSKTVQSTTDIDGGQGFGSSIEGPPRTWTYTYDAHGHILTANGPRTDVADVTSTAYYADDDPDLGKRGNVSTITNALGHVTSITAYNAHGQPLTIVDPNGLVTTLSYDLRQRLTSRNVGSEITSYDYDGVGQISMVTMPDGSFLSYSYDAAHRLTGIADNLGNRIAYTLDAMGNRIQEQVFDPTNNLAQTRRRVYSNLNRLLRELGAQNQTTQYAYDDQGNLTSVSDPLKHVTSNQYDALNRLIKVTDPNQGLTHYAYNGLDQLVGITDPRNLTTSYAYDGLSNLSSQLSPDTGNTLNTYDAAGNLLTRTDAKGQATTYTHDALNRVSSVTFQDGSRQTYSYDLGTDALGRLTSITELDSNQQATSVLTYAYDLHGRPISETRTVDGVDYVLSYDYDGFGRLSGMTYPSGRKIEYGFDMLGRISQVSTTPQGETARLIASNVAYHPFGGVQSYTLGNGRNYLRSYDLDGRIASYTLGAQNFAIGYDAAGRITFISDTADAAITNTYSYDSLDRLIGAVLPTVPFAYSYDSVGNRTSKTVGASTDTYAYSETSNQISSITTQAGARHNFAFDPNGSTTSDAVNQYEYDARGRMVQSTSVLGVTSYQVNALGKRFRKTSLVDDRVFLYDMRGHLIAEVSPAGTFLREYVYLADIPLVVYQ